MGMIRATREYAKTESNLLPNAENVRFFLDAVGRDTIQEALAAARAKAAAPREQRQLERLSSAVRYWEMAVYQGKLFAGTLPSGHVYSLEAGKCASHDRALRPGWRHLAAVKSGGLLKLYVDGECVVQTGPFDPAKYNLTNKQPLLVGFGSHDHFNGKMRDLRIYRRALVDADLAILGKTKP